ncbi:DUF3099 domain-containing protein [Aldersonia sp. NBC_00410]|uniref:DUF3099 domain-containing protein n=1 Tax=Aldersonia sp. NBC_00410 TaxID=2975954 RepID=UPI00225BA90F|nr:DUF3099 domain-containing protein [Aldersonia sp. NBC_00410]MCX5042577.1 DUF3099 domain-containing protein [Aldersonia sp. NBC_00410]
MGHISRFGEPAEAGSSRNPALITGAAPSFEEQHRARVRKYTIIMAFRIPALILAAVAYSMFESALVAVLIIAVSVPLPWIAVLIANDRPPRSKDEPSRYGYRSPPPPAIGGVHHTIDG